MRNVCGVNEIYEWRQGTHMHKTTGRQIHKTAHRDMEEQHEKVFKEIKKLSKSIKKIGGERAVFHQLFSLARCAEKHFAHEEQIMFESRYRQYQIHKLRHNEFIRKIGEIKSAYHDDRTAPTLPAITQNTLSEWLKKHIQNEDADVMAWIHVLNIRAKQDASATHR